MSKSEKELASFDAAVMLVVGAIWGIVIVALALLIVGIPL